MNYYERIQLSIDYIEDNLENPIDLNAAAQAACMSISSYYRMFFALVGCSVKEYIRLRRTSLAAAELTGCRTCVIDLAVKYDFESGDSFSRCFRRITGVLPSEFRKRDLAFSFERINIPEKYFDVQGRDSLEKYPDMKVLKKLEPIRVATYCHQGKSPEVNALMVMGEWMRKNGLDHDERKTRIFGYNNPSPSSPEQEEYGYEACVTIGDDTPVDDERVKIRTLAGGLYVVTSVRCGERGDLGEAIESAWKRFCNWLTDSQYNQGDHQWMEEHLGFDDYSIWFRGLDLYMPIVGKHTARTGGQR